MFILTKATMKSRALSHIKSTDTGIALGSNNFDVLVAITPTRVLETVQVKMMDIGKVF